MKECGGTTASDFLLLVGHRCHISKDAPSFQPLLLTFWSVPLAKLLELISMIFGRAMISIRASIRGLTLSKER